MQRSNNNSGQNPDFVAKVLELLGQTDEQLGLVDSCRLAAIADNQKAVAAALRKASEILRTKVNKEEPWKPGVPITAQLWSPDDLVHGRNLVTVCEAQWVNDAYPQGPDGQGKFFDYVQQYLAPIGCGGVETVTWRYPDPLGLIRDDDVLKSYLDIRDRVGRVTVLSTHCWGQCVTDPISPAHKGLCPLAWGDGKGNPFGVNYRAGIMMMAAAVMARRFQLGDVLPGFCGGAGLWQHVYDFGRSDADIEQGLSFLTGCWNPILDFFGHLRLVHGLEIHGTEGGFDYYSFLRICEAFKHRSEWGVNFDRSHFIWQGADPVAVMLALAEMDRLYHLHFKSVRFDRDPKAGIMRGLQTLGKMTKGGGWWFHTVGEGHDHRRQPENLRNDAIAIGQTDYYGPVSVENEQPGAKPEEQMERAVRNTASALFARGEVHMPDAKK